MKKYIKYTIIVALLVLIYGVLLGYFDIAALLSLDVIQEKEQFLRSIINRYYVLSVFGFIGVYIIHGSLALPATSLLMITGGFLFGVVPGVIYSLIGCILGGMGAYSITSLLFGTALNEKYRAQLKDFREKLSGDYIHYLIIVRLIPVIPFFLANILCGLALVPVSTFLWTLVVGIFPSLCIYSVLGTELCSMRSLNDMLTPNIILIFMLIALLTIVPIIRQRQVSRSRIH